MNPSAVMVRSLLALLLLAVLGVALPALGEDAGTVAAVDGSAEIGRAGTWIEATPGAAVAVGDQLRTGQPGRMRVVFRDDSVLVLSDDTTLVVDEQVFDPSGSESVFNLLQGKLRSVVSHYYGTSGSSYEVRSETAVAGVRGTEFVMTYDPVTGASEVVGIRGVVTVNSMVDPTGPGMLVTANEVTAVAPGELPSAPEAVDPEFMRELLHEMEFFGMNNRTSVIGASTVIAGASVPQPGRAPAGSAGRALAFAPDGPSIGIDASTALGNSPAAILGGSGSIVVDPGRP